MANKGVFFAHIEFEHPVCTVDHGRLCVDKSQVKISQNFVAFSEYMNFTILPILSQKGQNFPLVSFESLVSFCLPLLRLRLVVLGLLISCLLFSCLLLLGLQGLFDLVINAGAALVLELLEEARPWPLEELKIGLSAEAVLFSEAKRLLRCILK